ncbi:hypothetical protein [Mycoplasmopsis mustelae]|uniref:hypothetical protein n=1 Tax=Mycoplasmopsis mustelae TaxID=171289 RepID=UPI0010654B9C|nr:hypothetical protein [Mycoplasmopsis mustelae]
MSNKIDTLREVGWVVINETPQTDYYWRGGKGGKNTVFKNLKTGEILTIDEMIQKTDLELYILGLKKVFNPKLNEWYIRKLPNHTKKDNLG